MSDCHEELVHVAADAAVLAEAGKPHVCSIDVNAQ
jgi:hypothetical protein